jgi:CheY-like chemotaxis protein
MKVLLVEDNPINQRVALEMLAALGKHTVVTASNGLLALEILEKNSFDLVFMDLQMPVLDGFKATVAIREKEKMTKEGHIPIIAMTANAMKGDRERCLETGMDGYIAKPIKMEKMREEIITVLEQLKAIGDEIPNRTSNLALESQSQDRLEINIESTGLTPEIFDKKALWDMYGQNRDVLTDLVNMYFTDIPAMLAEVKKAVAARDSHALDDTAHALKGAVAAFEANPAREAAFVLERMGKEARFEVVEEALSKLETEIQRLDTALTFFREEITTLQKERN